LISIIKEKKMKRSLLIISALISGLMHGFTQDRTVGLFLNDTNYAYKGYTLFAPKHNTMTYLINNNGEKVHEWTASTYEPGQSVYLLENGDLLRTCMLQGSLGTGGGEGGRLEQYSWNDSLVWQMDYSTDHYTQHHDVRRLPNGHIIMLVVEKKTIAEAIAAGFNPNNFQPEVLQKGYMLPDCLIEIEPTPPVGGNIVWEWHVWDHLIQDYDPSKANYGVVSSHPELVDCDGDHRVLPLFWNHMNCVDYNPALDQVLMSVRGNSEAWIVDHSTTTAQSAGHTGGVHGKGGDLLYRWGNPLTYGAGNMNDQKYFEQHNVEWVKPDCPGAGNLTCFNNGVNRGYSSIDEITPPVDLNGNYANTAGTAFGPSTLTWTYDATPPESLFAHDISGAQRLPNGNTLIDDGPKGKFMEVTSQGAIVWEYVNPTINTRTLCKYDSIPHDPTHPEETLNSVFRVYRYAPDYAAFTGKTLPPQGPIECFPVGMDSGQTPSPGIELFQNYPNPTSSGTLITFRLFEPDRTVLTVYDTYGRKVCILLDAMLSPGSYEIQFDTDHFPPGIYFYTLISGDKALTKTMAVVKK
jgi:hypothetical protein